MHDCAACDRDVMNENDRYCDYCNHVRGLRNSSNNCANSDSCEGVAHNGERYCDRCKR